MKKDNLLLEVTMRVSIMVRKFILVVLSFNLLIGNEVQAEFLRIQPSLAYAKKDAIVPTIQKDKAKEDPQLRTISDDEAKEDLQAPTVPGNLSLISIKGSSAHIKWEESHDNSGVRAYGIYIDSQYKYTVKSTSYELTGLLEGSSYTVTVVAEDIAGNQSKPSDPLVIIMPIAPNSESVNIDKISPTAPTDMAFQSVTSSTYSYTDLTPNTSYQISVPTIDNSGNESDQSAYLNAESQSVIDLPPQPANLRATAISDNTASFAWEISEAAANLSYEVFIGNQLIGTTTEKQYSATGLTPSSLYHFHIIAFDETGSRSSKSNDLEITTLPDSTPPTEPANLRTVQVTETKAGYCLGRVNR
ncbi:fibronectin type III domain-containing protein [Cohnella boryungensis]